LHQPILRAAMVAEVSVEGIGEEVGGDQGCLRAGGEYHDGGSAGSGAEVEDAPFAGTEEVLGEEPGWRIHFKFLHDEVGGTGPCGEQAD